LTRKAENLERNDSVQMLQENGYPDMSPLEDINTEQEKALGKLVKKLHGTDFYILREYPLAVRPFYTMPCPHNKELSNSFDVFMRGEVRAGTAFRRWSGCPNSERRRAF
jgi:aspartyl-tRNA synthetase